MKIAQLKIRNVLGIRELDIEPGKLTEITGANGTGKSSVLKALRALVEGGHDATLIHKGADKGEVVLVLDDGTTIARKIGEKTSKTEVTNGQGMKVPRPAEFVKGLSDVLAVNPVAFLNAPKKDRLQVLLEAMPLTVDPARVSEISGVDVSGMTDQHALVVIEEARKTVYDERTGVNRAAKEKAGTISQLRETLPADIGDEAADPAELEAQIEEIDAGLEAERQRIDTKLAGLRRGHEVKLETLRAEIEKLNQQIAAEKEGFAAIEQSAERSRQLAAKEAAEAKAPIRERLAALRATADARARAENTRQTISTMEAEEKALRERSEALTRALEGLEAYKAELLANLPLPGIEVRDGEILSDGIPFDNLNTASQVRIAVEVARQRAGALGVVCVDGLEQLDNAAYAEFRKQMMDTDLQLFITRVQEGDFSVSTAH